MANARDEFVHEIANTARAWGFPYEETNDRLILYKSPWVKRQKRREKKLEQLAEKQQQGES